MTFTPSGRWVPWPKVFGDDVYAAHATAGDRRQTTGGISPADGLFQYPAQKSMTFWAELKGIEDAPYPGCTTTSPSRGGRHVRPVSHSVVDRTGHYGRGRADQPSAAAGPVHGSAGVRTGRRPQEVGEPEAESHSDQVRNPIEVPIQVAEHVADALEVNEPVGPGQRYTHGRVANSCPDQAAGHRFVYGSGRPCRWRSSAVRPDAARRLAIRRPAYLTRHRSGRTSRFDLETPTCASPAAAQRCRRHRVPNGRNGDLAGRPEGLGRQASPGTRRMAGGRPSRYLGVTRMESTRVPAPPD